METIIGETPFTDNGNPIGLTIGDFWQYQFSNIYDLQDHIAEFLVGKALGLTHAHNRDGWTLWDINYRNAKIEVKETGYYHSWQEKIAKGKISTQRSFGITPAYTDYKNPESELKRQSDIYVFCLNTGTTETESNPLNLDNWEFYVVPTNVINKTCTAKQKTISLGKVKKLAKMVRFAELKSDIDAACENLEK